LKQLFYKFQIYKKKKQQKYMTLIYPPHTSKAIRELHEIDVANDLIRFKKAMLRLEKARSKNKIFGKKKLFLFVGMAIVSPFILAFAAACAANEPPPISPPQAANFVPTIAPQTQRSSDFNFYREDEQSLSGITQAAYERSQRGISHSGVGSIEGNLRPPISNSASHVQNQGIGENFVARHSSSPIPIQTSAQSTSRIAHTTQASRVATQAHSPRQR
jgi:hypothetical protein